jgi:hypothetical protein
VQATDAWGKVLAFFGKHLQGSAPRATARAGGRDRVDQNKPTQGEARCATWIVQKADLMGSGKGANGLVLAE